MDFTYLQPPRQAFKIKKLKQEQFEIVDGKLFRKIFENVKYNEDEMLKINCVKQYLKEKQPSKIYQDAFVLKMSYLTVGTFSPLTVFDNIKKHQEWFENPNIAAQRSQGRKILEEGIFYSYGRDLEYSPIVYFYPSRVDTSKYSLTDYFNALYMLLEPIEQHMLIPGINQTFNIVIDMENRNFPLSLNTAKQLAQKVVYAYPYRLKRLFFIHTHRDNDLARCLKDVLKHFNYQVKPQFITRMEDFRKYIPDQEREQKYGGNLSDLNEFWPISLATKYEEEKSYFIVENTSETDYQSLINEQIMFQGIDTNESGCGICAKKNCQIY